MTFHIERLGLGERYVHGTCYCTNIKSRGTLTEEEVSTTSPEEATRVLRRESGLGSMWAFGTCGGSYGTTGTGGSAGGNIEEEEIQT